MRSVSTDTPVGSESQKAAESSYGSYGAVTSGTSLLDSTALSALTGREADLAHSASAEATSYQAGSELESQSASHAHSAEAMTSDLGASGADRWRFMSADGGNDDTGYASDDEVKERLAKIAADSSAGGDSVAVASPQSARQQSTRSSRQVSSRSTVSTRSLSADGLDFREIKFSEIELCSDTPLGRGAFGVVFEGEWRGAAVAVKKLMTFMDDEQIQAFRSEAAIMQKVGGVSRASLHCLHKRI